MFLLLFYSLLSVCSGKSRIGEVPQLQGMANAKRELIAGSWGRALAGSRSRAPGQGLGGEALVKLKAFQPSYVLKCIYIFSFCECRPLRKLLRNTHKFDKNEINSHSRYAAVVSFSHLSYIASKSFICSCFCHSHWCIILEQQENVHENIASYHQMVTQLCLSTAVVVS